MGQQPTGGQAAPHPAVCVGFGLDDMHGNVWEWCATEYFKMPSGNQRRWGVTRTEGVYAVVRGGSWASEGEKCRASARAPQDVLQGESDVGVRVICIVGEP
jgi:formylglycine-generating enzyme required for sulfatase activity